MFPSNGRAIKCRSTFYLSVSRTCNGSPHITTENDDTSCCARSSNDSLQKQELLSRCNPAFQSLFKIKYAGDGPRELCTLLPFLGRNLDRKLLEVRSECRT